MRVLAPLLLAAALGIGTAQAADQPPPSAAPGGAGAPPQMGGGMMAGGMMDMGSMQCMVISDQRLASAKTDLNITSRQLPAWNAFVGAVKANRQLMGPGMMQGEGPGRGAQPGGGMMVAAGTLPERLERQERMLSAHLEALRETRAAASRLYADLTPDQRSKADRLLCSPMAASGTPSAADAPAAHAH